MISPYVFNHVLAISPAPATADMAGAESLRGFASRFHREITQETLDSGNDKLELDLELLTPLRWRVMFYAAVAESGLRSSQAMALKAQYLEDFYDVLPKINDRFDMAMNTWRNRLGSRRGRATITGAASDPLSNPYNVQDVG